jgi:hypothetical protein
MGSSRLEDGPAFAEDMAVEVRFTRTKEGGQGDRDAWPWLPGTILEQCARTSGAYARTPGSGRTGRSEPPSVRAWR